MLSMQTPKHIVLARSFIIVLILVLAGCSSINDMFRKSEPAQPPEPLSELKPSLSVTQLWQQNIGASSAKSSLSLRPAFSGPLVFAADPLGSVSAYQAASGDQAWQTNNDLQITGGPGAGEGLVILGTENGEVLALHAEDGREAWRGRVSSEVLSVPLAANGIVVVRTGDGKLYGLNSKDGSHLWVYDRTVPALSLRGTSNPVIYEDTVIAGFDSGRLVNLELKNGQLLWETRVAIPSGRSELERLVDIDADPIASNGVIYVVTYQGRIAAVDTRDGKLTWRRDMSSHTGLGISKRNIYVTDDNGRIWALDRGNSASVWRQDKLERRRTTAPVDFKGYVVAGDYQGYLHFMDSDDGHLVARVQVDSEGIEVSPVVHGERLFVYGKSGSLTAIDIKQP